MIPFQGIMEEKTVREVLALSLLNHKNIIRYYQAWVEDYDSSRCSDSSGSGVDDAECDKCLFIQMEQCARTLQEVLWCNIDRSTAMSYFYQILKGISHIHEHGIIHRDLTSQNNFLTDSNVVKIADFGLAKLLDNGVTFTSCSGSCGNELYRAPEMTTLSEIDTKADIYSLGIVVFELFRPFDSGHERLSKMGMLKEDQILEDFCFKNLVKEMISYNPLSRPSAASILRMYHPQFKSIKNQNLPESEMCDGDSEDKHLLDSNIVGFSMAEEVQNITLQESQIGSCMAEEQSENLAESKMSSGETEDSLEQESIVGRVGTAEEDSLQHLQLQESNVGVGIAVEDSDVELNV